MKGIIYILISTTCFALINFCVKMLSGTENIFGFESQYYTPFQLVFFRSVISLSICLPIIRAKKLPFFGNNKKWLIIRGVFGATSLTMFFFTIQHLPIGVATAVQYLSPVFTVIFAIYLINEKVRSIQWLYFAISLVGALVIGFSGDNLGEIEIDPFWVVIGLVSAIFSGIAYNGIMKCRTTDAPITIVMYFPLIAAPFTLALSIYHGFVIPIGVEWILILCIGIFTQIAQVTMTRAFHSEKAAIVTPFKYFGAIYAILIGSFMFFEHLTKEIYFGITLIILGVILNSLKKIISVIKKKPLTN